jgi:Flp pilus assembly protein TadD
MMLNRASNRMIQASVMVGQGTSCLLTTERSRDFVRRAIKSCRIFALILSATAATACVPLSQIMPGAANAGASQTTASEATGETIARARAARANGELETAVRLYRVAMPAMIADPALRIELGETLADAGDHDQAYEAIDQALQSATGEAREAGYVALGRLFFKLRRPTESAAYFEKALVENPRNLRAMIGRGVALDITGKFDQAQAVYLKALEVAPGDLRAQNNLALSYAFAGNFARAVEILHPMATAATATPRLRQNLALIYGLMGNGELAASISRRDLDEATIQGNLRFYELLRRLPNPAEAVAGMGT